ncbi:MAG TPA: hypothetical protein VGM80_04570 [Gaiellaceae bacterium]
MAGVPRDQVGRSSHAWGLAGLLVIAALLLLATNARAASAKAPAPAKCSGFGPTWRKSYNAKAVKVGNPIRILAACCQSTKTPGIHHCYVTVTLAGTLDRGCESVDIGKNGMPAGTGKHEECVVHTTARQLVA